MTVFGLIANLPKLKRGKKRNSEGEVVAEERSRVGTRTEHFKHFISDVLPKLDVLGLKGYNIVMDNAPIHKDTDIRNIITSGGGGLQMCLLTTVLPVFKPYRGALVKG